jgi:PIN domain nuclease of toxin-antitoxin system
VEAVIYLDTHVVAWLYSGQAGLLPRPVLRLLERESKRISPMVELELQLLFEVGRIAETAATVLETVRADFDLELCDLPFHEVVRRAVEQSWTRDPFDRMIVAQAEVRGSRLLTRDATIRDHYQHALWLD